MPGVLSRLSAARPAIGLTLRPSATAGPFRRYHGHLPVAPPVLPTWVKHEVRKLAREVVEEETLGMKSSCLDRFDQMCTRTIAMAKDAATLHAQTMVMHVETKKELTKIAFRICISMGGLAVVSPFFRDGRSGGSGGDPPSREEIAKLVKEEVDATREELHKALKQDLEVIAANHFLAEEKKKDQKS